MLERCITRAAFVCLPSLIHGQSSMVGLPQDTAVLIKPGYPFSIRSSQKHQQVDLQVAVAVRRGTTIAIPRATRVIGEIVDIHRDWLRRIDRLSIKLLYISTDSGEHIPIHILREGEADWRIDLERGALPPDLETIAYVSRDMQLDLAAPPTLR